jgi:ketosteroid isomerase-like protein
MHPHETLIHSFYSAFQRGDYAAMQSCYHDEATFSDPVFQKLDSRGAKAMWQMLLTSAKDLKISFENVSAGEHGGSAHWEAWYTFSRTGRPVHNIIDSRFTFKEGKILEHRDIFDFWRWSKQALGPSGILLGWSPIVKNKVRATANRSLKKFMAGT